MKKFFCIILLVFILSSSSLISCEDKKEGTSSSSSTEETSVHTHTFGTVWISTENGHYKECSCHPEIIEIFEHRDSVDMDGKCDVCQYAMKKSTKYTFIVKDQNGNFVPNVEVKLFSDSFEKTGFTDKNGSFFYDVIYSGKVKALIKSVPEGYEDFTDEFYIFDSTVLEIVIPTI